MSTPRNILLAGSILVLGLNATGRAQENDPPTTTERPRHQQSASRHEGSPPPAVDPRSIPEGMTLDEVLELAASPPPASYPAAVADNAFYTFTLFEQLEYRVRSGGGNPLGWSAQGWIGRDFDKFRWKSEGQAIFEGRDEGESGTDLLYSRLISPFWDFQIGARYANEWTGNGNYEDTWSGAIGLQGLAPYMFELDSTLYVSEHGDVFLGFEAEYHVRITQRLVLQPRTELSLYAQDIPEMGIGAGLSDLSLDLRLRYEIKREFAPYLGIRFEYLVGETGNLAEAAGLDASSVFYLAGLRFAL
ncbi:copper resistance protein B [Guyparkeria sp.]|uniref:copper resistance protein B n=1 Tax=Guyparkeria sp. TaxID=2035736 RepID=UPI003970C02E